MRTAIRSAKLTVSVEQDKETVMQWTKPEFKEISLGGELTAYCNTDESLRPTVERPGPTESRSDAHGQRETSV
ncbi:MAG: pyrroloquinoline quinone precursor peptide PqqA [Planctomycetaceae bacterium]|nr:pyrroloquinoline quinone precursor peptide PqqA [Planctomycetaceae bacterium]